MKNSVFIHFLFSLFLSFPLSLLAEHRYPGGTLDLTGDGIINAEDTILDLLIHRRVGDADQDNDTDIDDFLLWEFHDGSVIADIERADKNDNGTIDIQDLFLIITQNLGQEEVDNWERYEGYFIDVARATDFNDDGVINNLDLAIWQANDGTISHQSLFQDVASVNTRAFKLNENWDADENGAFERHDIALLYDTLQLANSFDAQFLTPHSLHIFVTEESSFDFVLGNLDFFLNPNSDYNNRGFVISNVINDFMVPLLPEQQDGLLQSFLPGVVSYFEEGWATADWYNLSTPINYILWYETAVSSIRTHRGGVYIPLLTNFIENTLLFQGLLETSEEFQARYTRAMELWETYRVSVFYSPEVFTNIAGSEFFANAHGIQNIMTSLEFNHPYNVEDFAVVGFYEPGLINCNIGCALNSLFVANIRFYFSLSLINHELGHIASVSDAMADWYSEWDFIYDESGGLSTVQSWGYPSVINSNYGEDIAALIQLWAVDSITFLEQAIDLAFDDKPVLLKKLLYWDRVNPNRERSRLSTYNITSSNTPDLGEVETFDEEFLFITRDINDRINHIRLNGKKYWLHYDVAGRFQRITEGKRTYLTKVAVRN